MIAVVSIALQALAIYTRMALDWPITLWLLLGALVGTWYTSAKSWVADMKQNKMNLSDGKRFFHHYDNHSFIYGSVRNCDFPACVAVLVQA